MIPSLLLVPTLLGAALAAPASLFLEERQTTPCAKFHIIAGRGSNERTGPGSMRTLAAMVQAANPGTTLESIDYPALLFPYDQSSSAGTAAVTSQLTNYVKRCPRSKVILMGYSQVLAIISQQTTVRRNRSTNCIHQGAHIMLDSLCGGGGYPGLGPATPPIDRKIGDRVSAVVQYGDPRFILNQPYNAGTADHEGVRTGHFP